jgi:16S rRNA (cytidine1402-2'-O)-methyltransferase
LVGNCDIVLGRELTKAHEQLVRGPISTVLEDLGEERGEFTIVVEIGAITENDQPEGPTRPSDVELLGEITEFSGSGKRRAVASLAKKYGLPPNEVYAAIERAKKSVI